MQAIELQGVGVGEWDSLQAGEHQPWGGIAEGLSWAEKDRHVGVRGADGELLALAGALQAEVSVEGESFPVVGIGGVIVKLSARGQGLARLVVAEILRVAEGLGPEYAMLFCRSELAGLYERFDFRSIAAPVSAAQPEGRIVMPLGAMWRPLAPGARWPDGPVEVRGEPF
ncbi:MAG: GNAT family N-acetyltransferase [Solirubrobacteraceae bacterium]